MILFYGRYIMDISMSLDVHLHILLKCLIKMPLLAFSNGSKCYKLPTIGDKIVETLYSNRVTSAKKRIHSPPLPSIQSRGVCCFLLVAQTGAQHCMEGMGRKIYFPLLISVKRQKAPLRRSV